MLGIVNFIINILCLMFLLRLLFKSSTEMSFHPLLRAIKNYTDPVLCFLKKYRILNNIIHPIIPIILLLFIKTVFFQLSSSTPLTLQLFIISILKFTLFLFKFYLVIFWLVFSSDKYHFYDDFFHLFNIIFTKTFSVFIKTKKEVSIRNNPPRSLATVFFLFLIILSIIITALHLSEASIKTFSFIVLFITSIKLILVQMLELIKFMPQLLFIRIILSWFSPPLTRPLIILNTLTEPILMPARLLLNNLLSRLGFSSGVMDFSPILAFFGLFYIITIMETIISRIP